MKGIRERTNRKEQTEKNSKYGNSDQNLEINSDIKRRF